MDTEQGTTVEAEVTETAQETVPTLEQLKAERDTLKAEVEKEKSLRLGHERAVNRLTEDKKRAIDSLTTRFDALEQRLILQDKLRSGALDEAGYDAEVSKKEKEQMQKAIASSYEAQIEEALKFIKETFEEVGIKPDSAEGQQIKEAFLKTKAAEEPFTAVVRMAEKMAREQLKKSTPAEAELRKKIESELHEKAKTSPGLKVSTAKPDSVTLSDKEFISRYAEGLLNSAADHKRAREILNKL